MSTNFYAYKRIPVETRKSILESFTSSDTKQKMEDIFTNSLDTDHMWYQFSGLWDSIVEPLDIKPEVIHIGKHSSGWQFMWQVYPPGKYYEPNLKSIRKFFTDSDDWIIADEYKKRLTFDEFMEEIKNCLYHDPEKAINSEDYYRDKDTKASEFERKYSSHEFTTTEGLRCTMDEFS